MGCQPLALWLFRRGGEVVGQDAGGDGCWTLDAWDDFGERWIVHRGDLLEAVVLLGEMLGEMLGVDWEDV